MTTTATKNSTTTTSTITKITTTTITITTDINEQLKIFDDKTKESFQAGHARRQERSQKVEPLRDAVLGPRPSRRSTCSVMSS